VNKFISIGLLVAWLGMVASGCRPPQPPPTVEEPPPTGPTGLGAKDIADSWAHQVKGRQVKDWIEDLNSGESAKFPAAIEALTEAGPKARAAVPDLNLRLEDRVSGSRAYRLLIVKALGAIGPDAAPAVPNMLACLTRDDKEFLDAVKDAVQKIGPDGAIPALKDGLKDARNERPAIAAVVASLGPKAKDVVPTLIEVIKNEPKDVRLRIACIDALGAIGPDAKSATEVLKPLATDKNDDVKKSAEEALVKIAGKKS
jgi:HEAT repeat protein